MDGREECEHRRSLGRRRCRAHEGFARELVASQPDVIVTTSTPTTAAVSQKTATTPIVFTVVSDPIGEGFVRSLPRPGGNITGFVNFEPTLAGKWIGFLKEIDRRVVRVAGLYNPDAAPNGSSFFSCAFEAAARNMAMAALLKPVRSDADIEAAISATAAEPGAGLVFMADSLVHRKAVIEQAAKHRVPAVYPFRTAPADGGLMSYGPEVGELFRQVAPYVDRILKGTHPSQLPVQTPTRFELVINLRTAKALDLHVPPALLTRADDLVE